MRVELNTVALLMSPLIFLIRIVKIDKTRELFAIAEGGRTLRRMFRPVEFGLDDEILGAPGICEVDVFQIHTLKAVVPTCVENK